MFINNAGLMPLSPLAANKVDEWEQMVDVEYQRRALWNCRNLAALPDSEERPFDQHFIGGGACRISWWCGVLRDQIRRAGHRGGVSGVRTDNSRYHHLPDAVKSELSDQITDVGTAETIKPLKEIAIEADAIARAVAFHRATGRR